MYLFFLLLLVAADERVADSGRSSATETRFKRVYAKPRVEESDDESGEKITLINLC